MSYKGIKLAVTGAGKWGMNHIKASYELLGGGLKYVCDKEELTGVRLQEIGDSGSRGLGTERTGIRDSGQRTAGSEQRGIIFTTDFEEVLRDEEVNAVIIATSAETHYELAKRALEAGKSVLVEKPMTLLTSEARELVEISERKGLKLMVGHILLFHPAVLKMKELVSEGKLGRLQYIYSNRLNLGAIRTEENILWSFAPHDISVIQFLTGANPVSVRASGARFVQENIEDSTLTILEYPGNVHAHVYVSWLHPFKEQRMVVIGTEGMLVFEDTLKTEKLKFYRKGFKNVNGNIEKFESDFEAVEFGDAKPLEEEQKHFFECVLKNERPRTDGRHAVEVLEILEKATKQLR